MPQQLTKKHQRLYDKAMKNGMDAQALEKLFNKFIVLQQREQKAIEELTKINKALATKERKARTSRLIVLGLVAEKYFSEKNDPTNFLADAHKILTRVADRNAFLSCIHDFGAYYSNPEVPAFLLQKFKEFIEKYEQKTVELAAKAKAEAQEKTKAKKNAQTKDEAETLTSQ